MAKWLLNGEEISVNPSVFTPQSTKSVEYQQLEKGGQARITSEDLLKQREYTLSWQQIGKALRDNLYRLYRWDKDITITTHSHDMAGEELEPLYNSSGSIDYKAYGGVYKNWFASGNNPVIYDDGVKEVAGYTVDYDKGQVNFTVAKTANDTITADYYFRIEGKIDEYTENVIPTGTTQFFDVSIKVREM